MVIKKVIFYLNNEFYQTASSFSNVQNVKKNAQNCQMLPWTLSYSYKLAVAQAQTLSNATALQIFSLIIVQVLSPF